MSKSSNPIDYWYQKYLAEKAKNDKMMENVVDADVYMTVFGDATLTFDNSKANLNQNEKVKIIVIKDEENNS